MRVSPRPHFNCAEPIEDSNTSLLLLEVFLCAPLFFILMLDALIKVTWKMSKRKRIENEEELLVELCQKKEGKTKRFMGKLEKFKNYEDRLNNHQIIDYMIKGNKKETLIPRSGEFFVLKSKEYDDPSLALRIPVGELLDGTKTHSDLERKYSKRSVTESELYSSKGFPMRHSRLADVRLSHTALQEGTS